MDGDTPLGTSLTSKSIVFSIALVITVYMMLSMFAGEAKDEWKQLCFGGVDQSHGKTPVEVDSVVKAKQNNVVKSKGRKVEMLSSHCLPSCCSCVESRPNSTLDKHKVTSRIANVETARHGLHEERAEGLLRETDDKRIFFVLEVEISDMFSRCTACSMCMIVLANIDAKQFHLL